MESRWECILASIFNGFWWILVAKLGPSWEGKSSQDRPRQAKTGQDKASEGKGRERKRKGRDWKGKVWKSVAVDFSRAGGEGFARPLGVDLPRALDPSGRGWSERRFSIFWPSWCLPFSSLFQCLLGSILAPFSLPTCLQKSTKIH